VDSSGLVVPVSAWSYRLNDTLTAASCTQNCRGSADMPDGTDSVHCRRRLVVLEPVNSITAHVILDSHVSIAELIYG